MLVSALLLAWPLQQAVLPDLRDFRDEATVLLLEGGTLPTDYRRQLLAMPPAERIEAIIFLRRAGLLTGQTWQIDQLLKPAADPTETAE